MALIQKFDSSDLYDIALQWGRGEVFGPKGWNAIGKHLEQLSDDLGEDIEIDIIAICCDYNIAESAEDWRKYHGEYSSIDSEEWEQMDDAEKLKAVKGCLTECICVVICEEDCIIWQDF